MSFSEKDTIVICNEKSGTTVVLKALGKRPVVASEGSPKDILSCVGKSTPYYSRNIGNFISSRRSSREVLEDRYRILYENDYKENIKISFYDNMFFIDLEDQLVIVGAKQHISPFTVERYVSGNKLITVYMPENSPIIDELGRKSVEAKGGQFHTLNFGEKVAVQLL
ncbi:hypothetical protein IPM65_03370 [Candidatus Roizmanbacteria bacterium]|nr:MAG: hypothetical protein IPM65_03370 [Candidatus Roizmanbacteria bacterium]